jgi:predicted alpha-1,6-mannanase (GH76 family)
MSVEAFVQPVSSIEPSHRKAVSGLTIDGVFWRSDLLTLKSALKKYGSSLYLLVPKEIVKKLHLSENQ